MDKEPAELVNGYSLVLLLLLLHSFVRSLARSSARPLTSGLESRSSVLSTMAPIQCNEMQRTKARRHEGMTA